MDKALANHIGRRAKELLRPLEDEFGLVIALRGGSFDPSGSLVVKVEFAKVQDGVVMTCEASRLVAQGAIYGLPDDCLGKEFVSNGRTFVLTGMTARSAKWPFIARGDDGRPYRMTERAVKAGFGVEREA